MAKHDDCFVSLLSATYAGSSERDDYDLRVQFCKGILVHCQILHPILFKDEAYLNRNEINHTSADTPHGSAERTFNIDFQ
jgi:hypothetical protein